MAAFSLADLEKIIAERARSGDADSWTVKLVEHGIDHAAKKLGEEAVETVIAAINGDAASIITESADLIYHWLVVLAISEVPLDSVMAELEKRTERSGLAEKRSRSAD